jgi:hypothetical protein
MHFRTPVYTWVKSLCAAILLIVFPALDTVFILLDRALGLVSPLRRQRPS